jgi:hypothetical protein
VSSPITTSTSRITGTGEKKCRPRTRSGVRVHEASCAIGIDEVLVARIASGASISSKRWNSGPLTLGSSNTASTTSSAPAMSSSDSVQVIRSISACDSASSSLPPATARATDTWTRSRLRSSGAASGSCTTTWNPPRAADSAMPEPMKPAPITPIRRATVLGP